MKTFITTIPDADRPFGVSPHAIEVALRAYDATVLEWNDPDERPDHAVARLNGDVIQRNAIIERDRERINQLERDLRATEDREHELTNRHTKLMGVVHEWVAELVNEGTIEVDALIVKQLYSFGMPKLARDLDFRCDLGGISFTVTAMDVPTPIKPTDVASAILNWMKNTLTDDDRLADVISHHTDFTVTPDQGWGEIACEVDDLTIDDRRWTVRPA